MRKGREGRQFTRCFHARRPHWVRTQKASCALDGIAKSPEYYLHSHTPRPIPTPTCVHSRNAQSGISNEDRRKRYTVLCHPRIPGADARCSAVIHFPLGIARPTRYASCASDPLHLLCWAQDCSTPLPSRALCPRWKHNRWQDIMWRILRTRTSQHWFDLAQCPHTASDDQAPTVTDLFAHQALPYSLVCSSVINMVFSSYIVRQNKTPTRLRRPPFSRSLCIPTPPLYI